MMLCYLPNSFAANVVQGRLRNGDWMLFPRSRIEPIDSPVIAVSSWADFFCLISRELGRDGLELVVMLIPNKFTVYEPLLASPHIAADGAVLLGQLEHRLREGGIRVVNVSPAFRAAAADLAERHEYIYWRDDTHWNECGVSIAVAEFRSQIGSLPLPGYVAARYPPGGEHELGTTLPSNCEIQQATPEATTLRSERSQ
jgi:acetyltransferase AlgX (SGNH hydrolase-like protein)